jgi:hypothetical protein
MSTGQNYALVWLAYLGRLTQYDHLKIDEYNPRVYLLDSVASSIFILGRDVKDEPFLGVSHRMMPFFTAIDWTDVSICRPKSYLFLELRDPQTQILNMALGIKVRRSRLDVVCVKDKEAPEDMRFNMKVFEQDDDDPSVVVFSDQHELTGLSIKEIDGTTELGGEMDAEEARTILKRSGISGSYTTTKMKS